ncbi:hypothetical protein [Sorangium sp. So ce406]|uniref:hypothetical protein n=1 Tax=Sorangium sp. So ce406 TaxID=3133311 RepID=UPI003F5B5248
MTALDIELGGVVTCGTLKDGIAYAEGRHGRRAAPGARQARQRRRRGPVRADPAPGPSPAHAMISPS